MNKRKFEVGDRVTHSAYLGAIGTIVGFSPNRMLYQVKFDFDSTIAYDCADQFMRLYTGPKLTTEPQHLVLISTADYEKLEADLKAAQGEAAKLRDEVADLRKQLIFKQGLYEAQLARGTRWLGKLRRIRAVLDDCDS